MHLRSQNKKECVIVECKQVMLRDRAESYLKKRPYKVEKIMRYRLIVCILSKFVYVEN